MPGRSNGRHVIACREATWSALLTRKCTAGGNAGLALLGPTCRLPRYESCGPQLCAVLHVGRVLCVTCPCRSLRAPGACLLAVRACVYIWIMACSTVVPGKNPEPEITPGTWKLPAGVKQRASWRCAESTLPTECAERVQQREKLADELFCKEAQLFRVGLLHKDDNEFLHASLCKCRQTLADCLGAANQT